ncbi:Salivary acidic proline-rich phosphoprotein 1/2 [Paramarasmius palmivorus]|uniref:RNA helicase n=1 Tax=Paramarasmius palmivorus TaxID=297713 RepID=A0AAW0BRJ9_9AGAR
MGAKLRLFHDNRKPPSHRERSFKRPKPAWVDVSDDEGKRKNFKKKHSKILNGHDRQHPASPASLPRKMINGHSTSSSGVVHMDEDVDMDTPDVPAATTSKYAAIQEQKANLPIAKGKQALINEFKENDVTVLLGETGSGKTTQVPQYLLESGLAKAGMIAVTQPRRVAATSLATRVAAEQNVKLGNLVGYSVRFDERSSGDTRIKYMTDGMIVREMMGDPLLSKYSIVIVDEAHERSLRTDLLIANLKTIQAKRNGVVEGNGKGKEKERENPLKIIIMSATLDAEKFANFFPGAKTIYVQGRQHPVTIYHTTTSQVDYVDAAMRTFFQIHTDQPPGDVLIFLPGQEDIESLQSSLQFHSGRLPIDQQSVLICSMFASQSPLQNSRVFTPTPPKTRKCILATNIAETSITIPGVKYVIDTGKCKEKRYLAKSGGGGFDTLLTRDITQSSALQRAGRAGREGPGYCFRLYTHQSYTSMPLSAEPEILRCGLASPVLQLKCLGQDLEKLELMDRPDDDSVISALKTLFLIGALDQRGQITSLGKDMAAFPLEPVYSRALVASKEYGCTEDVLDIISVLSASSKLYIDSGAGEQREKVAEARRKFQHRLGDHLTLLNVVRAYREEEGRPVKREWCKRQWVNERALVEAGEIRRQLEVVWGRLGGLSREKEGAGGEGEDKDEAIIKALGHGLVANTAFLQPDGTYKQTMGQATIKIHPSSSLCDRKAPTIVYDEVVYTNQVYARGVSVINKNFLAGLGALKMRQA